MHGDLTEGFSFNWPNTEYVCMCGHKFLQLHLLYEIFVQIFVVFSGIHIVIDLTVKAQFQICICVTSDPCFFM